MLDFQHVFHIFCLRKIGLQAAAHKFARFESGLQIVVPLRNVFGGYAFRFQCADASGGLHRLFKTRTRNADRRTSAIFVVKGRFDIAAVKGAPFCNGDFGLCNIVHFKIQAAGLY